MSLSVSDVIALCKLTNKQTIYDVSRRSVSDSIKYLKRIGSERYSQHIEFLEYVYSIPVSEWLDHKELSRQVVRDYRARRGSRAERVYSLAEGSYSYLYDAVEIDSIVGRYLRGFRARCLVSAVLVVAVAVLCYVYFPHGTDEVRQVEKTENVVYVAATERIEESVGTAEYAETDTQEDIEDVPDISTDIDAGETAIEEPDTSLEEIAPLVSVESSWVDIDIDDLQSVNEDVRACLYFEGSETILPVLGCDNNETYLRANWKGAYSYAGSLFMDYHNSYDFSDPLTIIYGHNMKNGSMFGCLKRYSDSDYLEKNRYIQIVTNDSAYRYEVVAVGTISSESKLYKFNVFGLKDTVAEEYGYEYEIGERLVMLSTCTGLGYDSRYTVLLSMIDERM